MITGVVIALSEELGTITAKRIAKGNIEYFSDAIWLVNSGAGAENAKNAAELLIKQGANRLISWGCAAGLSKDLKPGDLVLADRCVASDNSILETDERWREYAYSLLADYTPAILALAESDSVISRGEEKLRLGRATQAAALDMESVAVAKVAKSNGMPFLVVRAIVDSQEMDLPAAVRVAVDEDGHVNLAKLIIHLIMHPYELPALICLGLHFKAAKNTLKKAGSMLDKLTNFDINPA